MANTYGKVSGTFQEIENAYGKVSGVWQEADEIYAKVSGTWELVFAAFEATSFATLSSGSGTFSVPQGANAIHVQAGVGAGGGAGEDFIDLTIYVVSQATVSASKTDRWSFLWDGEEVVHKVLHSLDFLRTSAELSEWYGRSFFFIVNPLMLPIPMDMKHLVERLNMLPHIQHELTSAPFMLTAARDLTTDWPYQGFLGNWRTEFEEACLDRYDWLLIVRVCGDDFVMYYY